MTVTSPSISPCLWFDTQLEEAATFYVSLFPNSSLGDMARYGDAGPGEPGTVMTGEFTLDGLTFRGINGGPSNAGFTPAISLSVGCDGQEEVDHYWDALVSDGGAAGQCGWLTDRFGLSWQIVPVQLGQALSDPDPARGQAAMRAMLGMHKIVIAELLAAAESTSAG